MDFETLENGTLKRVGISSCVFHAGYVRSDLLHISAKCRDAKSIARRPNIKTFSTPPEDVGAKNLKLSSDSQEH